MTQRIIVLIAACFAALPSAQVIAQDRPNILFFLSDDHRADVMGCAGHKVAVTPTLDRLAKQGTRFTNAFVTTSICAASRATIFTGLVERTHGHTFGKPPVSLEHTMGTYSALLQKAGYRTGFTGKYGINTAGNQHQKTFDYFKSVNRSPYFHKTPDGLKHEADINADNAIEFLRGSTKAKPFCLSVSFNSTHAEDGDKIDHYPWPPSADGMFLNKKMPLPRLGDPAIFDAMPDFLKASMNRDRWHWRWDTEHKYQVNMRAYFRMLYGMDAAIGRVLDEMEKLGLTQNTIIIFAGDNGYYMGERGFAGKWSHFEESLRVPLIIVDPRVSAKEKGRVDSHMVLNIDIAPTMLAYAGVAIPKHYQGVPLGSLTIDEAEVKPVAKWRTDFFCEHLMENKSIPKWEGVRDERYVYARYLDEDFEFLHDLKTDPDQLKNFAKDASYKDVLAKMRKRCIDLRDSYGGTYVRP